MCRLFTNTFEVDYKKTPTGKMLSPTGKMTVLLVIKVGKVDEEKYERIERAITNEKCSTWVEYLVAKRAIGRHPGSHWSNIPNMTGYELKQIGLQFCATEFTQISPDKGE